MFTCGNSFNFSIIPNKKIKNTYILYINNSKNFENCIVLNNIIENKIKTNIFKNFLIIFYLIKTVGIYSFIKTISVFKKTIFFIHKNIYYKQLQYKELFLKYLNINTINNNIFIYFNKKHTDILSLDICTNFSNIKISSSSIYKNLNVFDYSSAEFQFLRKNKVYNKGRYSRCRQNYRTGVYLCMYLSIVSIFGLYYWFFKFSFNFSHLWWFFIGFLCSFLLPKIIKYRLYEPKQTINSFYRFFLWFSILLKSFKI